MRARPQRTVTIIPGSDYPSLADALYDCRPFRAWVAERLARLRESPAEPSALADEPKGEKTDAA